MCYVKTGSVYPIPVLTRPVRFIKTKLDNVLNIDYKNFLIDSVNHGNPHTPYY